MLFFKRGKYFVTKRKQNPVATFASENVDSDRKQNRNDYLQNRDKFIKNIIENIQTSKQKPKNVLPSKIVIDFSSPNIAKPFHVGHFRSTIIGNFIANINKHFNNNVVKINYLGDWGTQFGILQYGLKVKKVNLETLQDQPIKTLFGAYVCANNLAKSDTSVHEEARKHFSDIECGKENLDSWKRIRQITVKELETTYKRLGIEFDDYHWESDYNGNAIKDLMTLFEERGIIKTDTEGRKVAKVNNKYVSILKSDLSTLYLSRDIAALIDRFERYKFNKMYYVVDSSQTEHFKALFEVVKQVNPECVNGCEHIKFGRVHGMSTRTGNVVFLNDILDEAKSRMYEKQRLSKNTRASAMNEETCDILGMSAVIINDLKQRRQRNYMFEWEKALQSEGDTGIKLQYLHCRLWNLEQNCNIPLPQNCDPSLLKEEIVTDVVAELANFEDFLQRSLTENEACILVNYLFRLAKYVNRMFNELRVKDENTDVASQRLLIFNSARKVLAASLKILGVKPLLEM